ncbi:hypothetical protein [Kordiimonas sp.]|uniref:hypothetical protein n=1 Tax=Kordiimonas sp. TaxID=1970157 RepID=UPI003A9059EC
MKTLAIIAVLLTAPVAIAQGVQYWSQPVSVNYGAYSSYGNASGGSVGSGSVGTVYAGGSTGSAYGAGYATGQQVATRVRGGLFGRRTRIVYQDAGFMGTAKQVRRVASGIRGQWVFYADGSRQWQWYR